MKNKKEQKTKIQPKKGKTAIAESSVPKSEKPQTEPNSPWLKSRI